MGQILKAGPIDGAPVKTLPPESASKARHDHKHTYLLYLHKHWIWHTQNGVMFAGALITPCFENMAPKVYQVMSEKQKANHFFIFIDGVYVRGGKGLIL